MEEGNDDRSPLAETAATTENDNGNGSDPKKFRSVLPHEPLPTDGDNCKGYVHLQGAFERKRKIALHFHI